MLRWEEGSSGPTAGREENLAGRYVFVREDAQLRNCSCRHFAAILEVGKPTECIEEVLIVNWSIVWSQCFLAAHQSLFRQQRHILEKYKGDSEVRWNYWTTDESWRCQYQQLRHTIHKVSSSGASNEVWNLQEGDILLHLAQGNKLLKICSPNMTMDYIGNCTEWAKRM